MTQFPKLFSPLRIGRVTVANRISFSAHLTNLAQLMRKGVVIVAGAVGDVESAFIVVRVADEAAARDLAQIGSRHPWNT